MEVAAVKGKMVCPGRVVAPNLARGGKRELKMGV